nr:uncharacterized protein LOC116435165 [Nomia melanderi]
MDTDVPPILLPCAICARTFMPQSLEKHKRICEQTANKKRKPFDSAKQRIQGTELAEFLPRQEKRRSAQDNRTDGFKSTWKQTHDDFLRQIRAARNEIVDGTMQKSCTTVLSSSAPTRANEQGVCPTCNRHFGIKAYDRHVAWCKDRIAQVPVSPATNIAKERLEARMKYRAPSLKSRRQITREKYSPNSATNLHSGSKTSPTQPMNRAKESASAPNCNKGNDDPIKQKPAIVRRSGQSKEANPTGPMKSRPNDRTNRPPEDESGPVTFRPAPLSKRTLLPVPPLKYKKQNLEEFNIVPSPRCKQQARKTTKRDQLKHCRAKPDEKNQLLLSARSQKSNIVSARSQGNPKLNDVSINVDVIGMTVKPCNIYSGSELTTWKRISEEKDHPNESNERDIKGLSSYEYDERNRHLIHSILKEKESKVELDDSTVDMNRLSSRTESPINWPPATPRLNRTYSFKKSFEEINDPQLWDQWRWKPVKNSPRVEFCLGNVEKVQKLHTCSINYDFQCLKKGTDDESLKDLDCKKKKSKNSEKFSGCFKSARDKILERKRLKSPGCKEFLQGSQKEVNCFDNAKIVYSKTNILDKSNNSKTCRDFQRKIDDTNKKIVQEDLMKLSNEKLASPIYFEQFELSEELNNLEVDKNNLTINDEVSKTLSRDKNESKLVDTWEAKEENVNNVDHSCTINESEFLAKNNNDITEFCDIEAKLNEIEYEPVLLKDVLRPSRSSTPFDIANNWNELENSPKKLNTPPQNKWEVSINKETGSELLYRVEIEESICPHSTHTDFDKLKKIDTEITLTKHQDYPTNSFLNDRSSMIQEGEVNTQIINKNDMAIQTTICKCSLKAIDESVGESMNTNESLTNKNSTIFEKNQEASSKTQVVDFQEIQQLSKQDQREINSEEISQDYKEDVIDNPKTDSESKFTKPITKTIEIADEEVQEIYKNSSSKDFDYTTDESINEYEVVPRCAHETSIRDNVIDARNLRSMILSESRMTVKESSGVAWKSQYSKMIGIENKMFGIENKMFGNANEMNSSKESLSSIDGVDLAGVKQVETLEVETIEEIGTRNRSIRFRILPEIKGTTVMVKKDYDERGTISTQTYWEKASKTSRHRLINLDSPCQRTSSGKDYNPFLLAEQQMNDLLSDASEQSVADSPLLEQNRETPFPLSHSSAFVKYPYQTSSSNPNKRSSLIAPPTEFDDLTSDFSSDSTETNSLSREVFLKDDSKSNVDKKSPVKELGRRVIIDKSKALGGEVSEDYNRGSRSFVGSSEKARKILDKVSSKMVRPTVNRSFSVRASSAPKTTLDKKNNSNETKKSSNKNNDSQRSSNASLNNRNNNYTNLSGSNLSLSSIVSSDVDIKRSNSAFDELMTSFEDENGSFTSLKSLLKNDPLSVSSPVHGRQRNDQNSDEELSSPESYKRQDHGKFSGDSAYSRLIYILIFN